MSTRRHGLLISSLVSPTCRSHASMKCFHGNGRDCARPKTPLHSRPPEHSPSYDKPDDARRSKSAWLLGCLRTFDRTTAETSIVSGGERHRGDVRPYLKGC